MAEILPVDRMISTKCFRHRFEAGMLVSAVWKQDEQLMCVFEADDPPKKHSRNNYLYSMN